MNPIPHAQSFLFVRPIMLLMGSITIWASPAFALDGQVQIHDPSTIIQCNGKFYTYGTGGSSLVSDDGWTWRRGVTPARRGMAPDIIHLGDGKLFLGSGGRVIGPGHFGLLDLGDGVQKFSCHYEADLDRGGASVLDIRPLLWKDGWPVAGDNFKEGTYEIESVRTGTALELAVEGVPVGGRRSRRPPGGPGAGGGGGGMFGGQGGVIPPQDVTPLNGFTASVGGHAKSDLP